MRHVNEGPDHPFGFHVRSTPLDSFVARIGVKLETCFPKNSETSTCSPVRIITTLPQLAKANPSNRLPPPLPYSRFPIQSARRINFKIGRSLFKRRCSHGTKIESRFESEGKRKRERERGEKGNGALEATPMSRPPLGQGWFRVERRKDERKAGVKKERRVCVRPYALTLTRIQVTYTFA